MLGALKRASKTVVDEPARRVISHQRRMGGLGTSEQDPHLFINLMLQRAVQDYKQHAPIHGPVFFDRGIPDLLAYAKHFDVNPATIRSACQQYKYRTDVFFMPAWEKIYTQDEERRMSFKEVQVFGDLIHTSYIQVGYKVINMPLGSVNTRLDFILSRVF